MTRTPNTPPVAAQSTVTIAAGQLHLTYTVPLQSRQVVIESCHTTLSDVANAATIHSDGRTYLLVQLKPSRTASCASGQRGAVALPADDRRYVGTVAAAINHSCCSVAAVIAPGTHSPIAPVTPLPKTSPSSSVNVELPPAKSTPAAKRATTDWVESEGLFSFVRVANRGRAALRVSGIEILACRNVALGCGRATREFSLDGRSVATIATVASSDERSLPAFTYRYQALAGNAMSLRTGSSNNAAPRGFARMSAQDIRGAEAGVLAAMRGPSRPAPDSMRPPRLLQRGSSRLAIGQTGTALVRLIIAENGTPQEATIVSITNRRLTAAAIETAVSSTYAPAMRNGRAVAAKYIATFSFTGEDPATAAIPVWKRSPTAATSSAPEPSTPPTPAQTPSPSILVQPTDLPSAPLTPAPQTS